MLISKKCAPGGERIRVDQVQWKMQGRGAAGMQTESYICWLCDYCGRFWEKTLVAAQALTGCWEEKMSGFGQRWGIDVWW
jgi:hypothetical protein